MGHIENGIQTAILQYLNAVNILAWRQNNMATPIIANIRGGRQFKGFRTDKWRLKGIADITGILSDGRRLEIEVKSESGKQSAEQKEFEGLITRRNGLYILARSVEDVIAALRNWGVIK